MLAKSLMIVLSVCSVFAVAHESHVDNQNSILIQEKIDQEYLVKVFFDDLNDAMALAATIEPMQSKYELGYLLFHLDAEEYDRLKTIADRLKLNIEFIHPFSRESVSEELAFGVNLETIPTFPCYRTVEETFEAGELLTENHPTLARMVDIGDSFEKIDGEADGDPGYDIYSLILSNSEIDHSKPKIVLSGSVHPREYTTAEMVLRFGEFLVDNYGKDPDVTWVLDYHEVHIILIVNPDGRKIAEQQILRRKNLNSNFCPERPERGMGIDLNRNFPFAFGNLGGSSGNACSETFRGPFALSEPEAKTLMDYLRDVFPDQRNEAGPQDYTTAPPRNATGVYLDVHSSGQLMLYPFGPAGPPTGNPGIVTLARKYGFIADHFPQSSSTFGGANGNTKDAAYGELGVAAYTVELGTEFFEACDIAENLVFAKNMQALLYSAKVARTPYITSSGPDVLNLHINHGFSINSAVPPGTDITINAMVDDGRYNNTNGTEPVQNISRVEYTIDSPPWLIDRTADSLDADDGNFDAVIERVSGVIDTQGLENGRHTIYVQASDENGDFGAVTALFFYIDDQADVPSVLFADGFETDLNWEINPDNLDTATSGTWQRGDPEPTSNSANTASGPKQLDVAAKGNFAMITGLNGGNLSANDVDAGTTTIRSPRIAIPESGANLSLSYYFSHTNTAGSEDKLRFIIESESENKIVFEEQGQINDDDAAYERFNLNLNDFAGEEIRLTIAATDAISNGASTIEAAIDDVIIISGSNSALPTPEPTPSPVVTVTPSATPTATPDQQPNRLIEAETGSISGLASQYSDISASGGQGISLLNFIRSSLTVNDAPESAFFFIGYAALNSGEISIRINQREIGDVSFIGTGSNRGVYSEFRVDEFVSEGSRIEIFTDNNDASISLDYLRFGTNGRVTPTPTPTLIPTPGFTFSPTPRPTQTPTAAPTPTIAPQADWYFIVHKPTGAKIQSCSTENDIPITSRPNTNLGDCVQWKSIKNGDFFYLQNRFSRKYMKPDTELDGSPISVQPNTWRGNWTQWSFDERGDGFGHIVNRATGKYIFLARTRDNIAQQPSTWRGDFTRWKFEAVP